MLIGPGLLEGIFSSEGAVYLRSAGDLFYNGVGALSETAHNAGTWEVGDLLIGWFSGLDRTKTTTVWTAFMPNNNCHLAYRYATSNSGDGDESDDYFWNQSYSAGASAQTSAQVIALAVRGGGTVELVDSVHKREQSHDATSVDMSMPSIGVGPNPADTLVLGYWVDEYGRTRPDLETWGSPKGHAIQTMDDDPDGLSLIGRNYGDPDNSHEPPYEVLGYPFSPPNNLGYYYRWGGWGYVSQAVSAGLGGGDIATYPGNSATPFWSNSNYSSGYLRFGVQ